MSAYVVKDCTGSVKDVFVGELPGVTVGRLRGRLEALGHTLTVLPGDTSVAGELLDFIETLEDDGSKN